MSEPRTIFVYCERCGVESTVWTPAGNDGEPFRWDCSPCATTNWAFTNGGEVPNVSEMDDEEIYHLIVGDGGNSTDGQA